MKKIKSGFDYKGDEVSLVKLTAEYNQEPDDSSNGEVQELKITTEDAGGGTYYVIETKRWAIDKVEDLVFILEDFKKRFAIQK